YHRDRLSFPTRRSSDLDDFFLELQRTGRPGEEEYLHAAVELAQRYDAPVVATNDVRFLERDDFETHEVRVCIHDGRVLDDPKRQIGKHTSELQSRENLV